MTVTETKKDRVAAAPGRNNYIKSLNLKNLYDEELQVLS